MPKRQHFKSQVFLLSPLLSMKKGTPQLELIFFNKNILLKLSWTALSGVLAPLVTPMTNSLSWFSISSMNFSVTISPDMVRWVMVLSAPMQSALLMWKERTLAFWGISRRWAVLEESHPPTTRMKSRSSSLAFSTRSWMASCRSYHVGCQRNL